MEVDRRPRFEALARWAAVGVFAGTLTFAIDRMWSATSVRGAMRWRWIEELTSWSGHVVLALAVVVVASTGAATRFVLSPSLRERWLGRVGVPTATVLAILTVPLHVVGSDLASGPWISEQSYAPLVVWAPTIGLLLSALVWLGLVAPLRASGGPWWRFVLTTSLVLALAALAFVDHDAVPGLYPRFHQLVEAAIAASAVALVDRIGPETSRQRIAAPLGVLGAFAAISLWFFSSSATRGALLLRSSFAQLWMPTTLPASRSTVLRELLNDMDVHARAPDVHAEPARFAGRGDWNIVLVVVDTMRADAIPPARPQDGLAFARSGDTPRIDAWLRHTYRFEHAYAPASATRRSMPAMLRSIEASEDPQLGIPIGERMGSLGLLPLAVVNSYFRPARHPEITALLDGFARVTTYANDETASAVPAALGLAASASPQRFLLFLHLYALHRPGFDGAVIPRKARRIDAYRRSLVYLDRQFGALLDGLESLGLRDDTIVVLTSDHGEGLGDHDVMLHGPNVFDEDVRVPLAFEIPGKVGHVIDETVGTIDLVPTLVDLLGERPPADARGRSLVPLFVAPHDQPERIYYFENWKDERRGVVRGRDKVIFERPLGLAFRFDLEQDPGEYDDIHDVETAHPELLRRLIELEPELVAGELDDDETQRLLLARLGELDPLAPGPTLDLLVRLVANDPRAELVSRCAELFEQGGTDVRVVLASRLLDAAPARMTELVVQWLAGLEGEPSESAVVEALARAHVPAFAPELVAQRMQVLAEHGEPSSWTPWLRLVRFWPKPQELFAAPLSRMLQRTHTQQGVPRVVVQLLRQNLASLDKSARR